MEIDELKEWLKERISALDGPLVQNGDLVRAKTYQEVLSILGGEKSTHAVERRMPFPVFNLGPEGETHYQTYHRGFRDGWRKVSEVPANLITAGDQVDIALVKAPPPSSTTDD